MTQNTDLTPSGFADVLLDYVIERELPAENLITELRAATAKASMNITQFCAALETIQQLDPLPALGMRIGRRSKPQNFGVVGYLVLSCNNLGQALTRYRRFQSLLQTGLKARVAHAGDNYLLSWTQQFANTQLAYEFSVAAFVSLYQSLIGEAIPPLRIGLPCPKPKDSQVYEAIMGCPVIFDTATLNTEIPGQLMAKRISSSDPYLRELLEQRALAMLNQPEEEESELREFNKQLQIQLLDAIQSGDMNAETTARQMGYSLRTFYRKLKESGHSYRSIIADTRMRLAKQYLSDMALSHLEVALLLGYAEQSSFIRAFKSWMGITPKEYRSRLTEKRGITEKHNLNGMHDRGPQS